MSGLFMRHRADRRSSRAGVSHPRRPVFGPRRAGSAQIGLARAALLLFASLWAGAAAAQPPLSLKETRALEAETQSLSQEVAYTNSVCGLSMSAAVDWPSAWTDIAALIAQCDRALGAVEASCRAGAPKAEIAGLARFVCAGDGAGPSIRGRTFRFGAARDADSFERTRVFIEGLR